MKLGEFELNKIYCMDCLEGLKKIPDNSVDLVFFDPPYNQKKNYGIYKDNLSKEGYEDFMKKVISESLRISNGKMCIFVSDKLTRFFWNIIPNSQLIIIKKFASGFPYQFKNIFCHWHSILTTVNPNQRIPDLWEDVRLPGEGYFYREERTNNPGQTSLKLTDYCIKYFSNEGDVIVDPFIGSGTTAVICKQLKRKFLGFEINLKYIEEANKRLSQEILK